MLQKEHPFPLDFQLIPAASRRRHTDSGGCRRPVGKQFRLAAGTATTATRAYGAHCRGARGDEQPHHHPHQNHHPKASAPPPRQTPGPSPSATPPTVKSASEAAPVLPRRESVAGLRPGGRAGTNREPRPPRIEAAAGGGLGRLAQGRGGRDCRWRSPGSGAFGATSALTPLPPPPI